MASLTEQLDKEVKVWEAKTYTELLAIEYPRAYERGIAGETDCYQVEVDLLERNDKYVHVSVAVSNGGLSSFFPKSRDFLAYADDNSRD
jgi:hypothetical protein